MKAPSLCLLVILAFCALGEGTALAQVVPDIPDVEITGEYGPFLPTLASKDGGEVDQLISILHWFMAVLFVGWGIFFVYCLVRFRQREGHQAKYEPIKAKVSKYGEIAVAGFEVALLVGLSMPIWASVKNDRPTEADNPFRVRVIAEQFQWNFHYPGADGVFGKTGAEFVDTAENPAGIDPNDPGGQDDVVKGELHIPVDRPIIADLSSKDVIHSFFLPVMRVKQDTIPGMRIPVWFEATMTGIFEIACAQLCGNNHYSMKALMYVQSEQEVEDWIKKASIVEEFDEDDLD